MRKFDERLKSTTRQVLMDTQIHAWICQLAGKTDEEVSQMAGIDAVVRPRAIHILEQRFEQQTATMSDDELKQLLSAEQDHGAPYQFDDDYWFPGDKFKVDLGNWEEEWVEGEVVLFDRRRKEDDDSANLLMVVWKTGDGEIRLMHRLEDHDTGWCFGEYGGDAEVIRTSWVGWSCNAYWRK